MTRMALQASELDLQLVDITHRAESQLRALTVLAKKYSMDLSNLSIRRHLIEK